MDAAGRSRRGERELWRFLEGAAVTQAGQDFLPPSQNKQTALVRGRAASENAFFVLLAKAEPG